MMLELANSTRHLYTTRAHITNLWENQLNVLLS